MSTPHGILNPPSFAGIPVGRLEAVSRGRMRYSAVLVLAWIGLMKFTSYEAEAIQGLVASSPLMAWLNTVLSVQGVANLIDVTDFLAAALLTARPWSAKAGVAGAVLAIGTFTTTLTFLITAPGWEASLGGSPALSVVPGQFLIKDAVLLSVWVFLLIDAWNALRTTHS